jgi:hypothetical protein
MYFIHKVRCNAPANALQKAIQEAVQKYSCTLTENPKQIYQEICDIISELNQKHSRCAYESAKSHALDWGDNMPHTISIASHKKTWETAHCTIVFDLVQEPTDSKGEYFTCKACNHELSKDFCLKTKDFCYLCDPEISISDLLGNTGKGLIEPAPSPNVTIQTTNQAQILLKALCLFSMSLNEVAIQDMNGAYEHQKQVFHIFEDSNYYFQKWKVDCDGNTLCFASFLNDKELYIIYSAYEAELRSRYVF